jgi:hypothetical protein
MINRFTIEVVRVIFSNKYEFCVYDYRGCFTELEAWKQQVVYYFDLQYEEKMMCISGSDLHYYEKMMCNSDLST